LKEGELGKGVGEIGVKGVGRGDRGKGEYLIFW